MKVELKVNDKSVQAEISEEQLKETILFEQLKKLGLLEDKPKTGYERIKKGETYYVINTEDDSMLNITEFNDQTDERCYNKGNYYNDKVIAKNNARADRLLVNLDNGRHKTTRLFPKKIGTMKVKRSGLLYIVLEKCTQSIIILCDYLIQYISPPKKKPKKLSKHSEMN